jgi:hypothetical protein
MRIAHSGLILTASLLLGVAPLAAIFQAQDKHDGVESGSSTPDPKIKTKMLAAASLPLKLGSGPVTVTLAPASASEEMTLSTALKGLKPEEHLYLVLRDLKASEPPGVAYDVYLDLPPDAHPKPEDPHTVGTLNFYNSVGVSAGNPGFFFSFDVTGTAKLLQSRNLLNSRTAVTISPSGNPAAHAKAVIGRIELLKQ